MNSAEGIQNMCATQIMTKSKSLRTGFSSQGGALDRGSSPVSKMHHNFNLFPSQSHEKLEEIPFHSPEEWLPFPPTPVLFFFLFFFLITVNYSKNIVQITAAHLISWIKTQNVVFFNYIELKAILCTVFAQIKFHVNHPC